MFIQFKKKIPNKKRQNELIKKSYTKETENKKPETEKKKL